MRRTLCHARSVRAEISKVCFGASQPSGSIAPFNEGLLSATHSFLKSGATPLELFALLLFAFPLLFTLQKLLELLALGERSHQFAAEPGSTLQQYTHTTYFTLSFLIRFERSSFSLIMIRPILSTFLLIFLEASAGGNVFPSQFVKAPWGLSRNTS